MRIIIDIGHPAHVHLFRNLHYELKNKGHVLFVTVKDIPSAKILLDSYQIKYIEIGGKSDSLPGKIIRQIDSDWQLFNLVRREKIELGLGSTVTLAHVSKITSMKSMVFDDDDSAVQPLFAKFAHPFSDYLISPDVLNYERKKNHHITYAGYHELAYLHPNRFKVDPGVLKEANLVEADVFFILRFNAFKAHHDVGVRGLSLDQKLQLVKLLEKKGRVFITTERDIEPELQPFQYKLPPEKIHSFIYYAQMLIGDSQTMTSEAAVLGTPAIRCNTLVGKISYLKEEEDKYGLTYGFQPQDFSRMQKKIQELLQISNLKDEWQKRRLNMLEDKIDVTSFFEWLVENFPESIKIIKSDLDSDFQKRFKCKKK
jgi:predicted glycosyltransferase